MTGLDPNVEEFIRQAFEENFELLRAEGGHSLAPDVKEAALQQVLLYWRKLRAVAEKITDTEVKLNLPEQKTPRGRTFGIEGVVDIVRENEQTVMYDIKSHDARAIKDSPGYYEQQLNVYAYIWQKLRHQPLSQTAIIATAYPDEVAEALLYGDEVALEAALGQWDPVVEIPFCPDRVESTISEFAGVVDAIEDGLFAPPPLEWLRGTSEEENRLFASRVCTNCDARFSCDSYRAYALGDGRGQAGQNFRRYFNDPGPDVDVETWRTASLDAAETIQVLAEFA